MDTPYYEDEVSFKELFYYFLHKWKGIIAAVLIGAVLFGGYKAYSMLRITEPEPAKTVDEATETARQYWEAARDKVQNEWDYQQNSILYNLDINGHSGYRIVYSIIPKAGETETDTEKASPSMFLYAYNVLLKSGDIMAEMAEEEGIPARYLSELIQVSNAAAADSDNNCLQITVYHNAPEDAKRVAQMVAAQVPELAETVMATVGPHEYKLLIECPLEEISTIVIDNKIRHDSRMASLQTELEKKEKAIKALDPDYLTREENGEESVEETAKPVFSKKSLLIYTLLGAVIGVVFMIAITLLIFFGDKTLNQASEIEKRYRIQLLGSFNRNIKRNGPDRLFDRWEGRRQNPDFAQGIAALAERIKNRSSEAEHIMITGMAGEAELRKFAQALGELLPEKCFTCGVDLLNAPEAMKKLRDQDGVLLIEACAVSPKEGIRSEIELIREADKKFLGYVVLE